MSKLYESSDYAGCSARGVNFYYGYEVTKCSKCRKVDNGDCEVTCPDADQEWCFEAKRDGKVVMTLSASELDCEMSDNMVAPLVTGIMKYIETCNPKNGEVK